jgi:hypothetical protein
VHTLLQRGNSLQDVLLTLAELRSLAFVLKLEDSEAFIDLAKFALHADVLIALRMLLPELIGKRRKLMHWD